MKKIFKISALIPVLALATGCSSDNPPADTAETIEDDFTVVMSINAEETRAENENPLYSIIDKDRVYFATFDIDGSGNLKDWLYKGGNENTALEATYFTPNWGPSVSAKLPQKDYKNGFFTGVFSIPAYANASFDMKQGTKMTDAAFLTLQAPTPQTGKEVWAPASDKEMPMAGITKITPKYLEKYKESIHSHTPLKLPETALLRAMAKIVIVDEVPGGIISKASLESLKTGYLTPKPSDWFNGTVTPYSPAATASNLFTQTLTHSNGTAVSSNGTSESKPAYVFYTFERDFTGVAANANERKVITLTADSYNLPENKRTIKISFAPYGADKNLANPTDAPTGDWAGILRNTVYTFHVYEPPTGGIQIQVTSASWEKHEKDEFKF